MRRLLFLALLATSCTVWRPFGVSRQLVVVTAPTETSTTGTLRRFELSAGSWRAVGQPVPVTLGRTGISEHKREGDGRSPAGVFAIGPAFGFAPTAPDLRISYLPLTSASECVDDVSSTFYDTIVERNATSDWKSSEKMRAVDVYKWGAVVDYNHNHTVGAGSCIFLHIDSGKPTAGCTAMSEADLVELLRWLGPNSAPQLVQLTEREYARRKGRWRLP
jgi:L,D-peptidoglycan transpeptidase YkuD (ErfK/YbiS/YcfS/YnhG family)